MPLYRGGLSLPYEGGALLAYEGVRKRPECCDNHETFCKYNVQVLSCSCRWSMSIGIDISKRLEKLVLVYEVKFTELDSIQFYWLY